MRDYPNESARGRAPDIDASGLRDRLRADAVRTRREATLGLVARADDGVAEATAAALSERAVEDRDSDVRQFAVEALGTAGERSETIETALNDDDKWVRAEAVVALSRTIGAAGTARLREALEDEAGMVRRNALIALAKLDAIEPELLRERLKQDPHAAVREHAAAWLGSIPGDREETVTLLAAVLARDPEALVRTKAAASLGQLGTDRAIEALETQGLADRSDDVTRAAKRAIAAARGEDPSQVELEDPPAPGGGPTTPDEAPTGRGGGPAGSNATRRMPGDRRGGGDAR